MILTIPKAQNIAYYPLKGDAAEDHIIETVEQIASMFAGTGIDQNDLREALRVLPEIILVSDRRLLDSTAGRTMIETDPWCANYAIRKYPDLASELLTVILQDGGATYDMLLWRGMSGNEFQLPKERIFTTLTTSPYWVWRWLSHSEDEDLANFLRDRIQSGMHDPSLALLWLLLAPDEAKDIHHWKTACEQAETLYYASYLPGFDPDIHCTWPVFGLTPKWSCHLLLSPSLIKHQRPEFVESLIQQPEWVAEYISRSPDMPAEQVKRLSLDTHKTCMPSKVLNLFTAFCSRHIATKTKKSVAA